MIHHHYQSHMNFNAIIVLALLIVVTVQQSQPQKCQLSEQLHTTIKRQRTGTTCQISYQYNSCSSSINTASQSSTNNNTSSISSSTKEIKLKSCTGYTCNFFVGDNCYYYSSVEYTAQKCLEQCCPTILITNQKQLSYSDKFQKCFQSPSSQTSSSSQSSPSLSTTNKILIIVCCSIAFLTIVLVIAFVCFRKRINSCFNIKNNKVDVIVKDITNTPKSSQIIVSVSDLQSPQQCYSSSTIIKQQLKQQLCTICVTQFTDSITKCKHSFHTLCLASWVRKNQRCPNCSNQDINPITVLCQCCKKPYVELKINKNLSVDKLQRLLRKIQCKHCKSRR